MYCNQQRATIVTTEQTRQTPSVILPPKRITYKKMHPKKLLHYILHTIHKTLSTINRLHLSSLITSNPLKRNEKKQQINEDENNCMRQEKICPLIDDIHTYI